MRIAFYAPLKAPTDPVPSGDRRVARLLMQALQRAGHEVVLASDLRSFEGTGDAERQRSLRDQALAQARQLVTTWLAEPADERPALWFTYHLYYKAPDWLGPLVAQALGIPYVVYEASFAPKRADGPWRSGHACVARALAQADLLLAPTQEDVACLQPMIGPHGRIVRLPPFLDVIPYLTAAHARARCRAQLCEQYGMEPDVPWLLALGMMRPGDKLESYRQLALALAHVMDLPWRLLVVGDGVARDEVGAALNNAAPGRIHPLGLCEGPALAAVTASADLCVWPAVNEAYGMALLEAQAAAVPVVACATRGVPEVVCDGASGVLVPGGDMVAFAGAIRQLLNDPERRLIMAQNAAAFARTERSLEGASAKLHALLEQVLRDKAARKANGVVE